VLNIPQKQFCYVKPDDLFLCGFSAGDALRLGYDFCSKIIHPKDLSLWTDMRKAVLCYLKDFEEKRDEIDFFPVHSVCNATILSLLHTLCCKWYTTG
jgi:hypothetical protein